MKKMIELNQAELTSIVGGYCEEGNKDKDIIHKVVCNINEKITPKNVRTFMISINVASITLLIALIPLQYYRAREA